MGKGYVFQGGDVWLVRHFAELFVERLTVAGRRVRPVLHGQVKDGEAKSIVDVCGPVGQGTEKLYEELSRRLDRAIADAKKKDRGG